MPVLFIDESKSKRYLFAVTVVEDAYVSKYRKRLQKLVKPGQRSIHFSSESDSRRRKILAEMCQLNLRVSLIETNLSYELSARGHCFEQALALATSVKASRIVIERDDSLFNFDENCLKALLRVMNLKTSLSFEHVYKHEDPLLWVSDAVAWCQNRGGEWERASSPLIRSD